MTINTPPGNIDETFEITQLAFDAFIKGETNPALVAIQNLLFEPEKSLDHDSRNRLFQKEQSRMIDNIFEGTIDSYLALLDNNHVLMKLQELFASNVFSKASFNESIKISNTLIEICENRIESIKKEDDDIILENGENRFSSAIQRLYDEHFIDYTYTEGEPNHMDPARNVHLLKENGFEIFRSTNDLVAAHLDLAQLKIAYYSSVYESETPVTPMLPSTQEKITQTSPEQERQTCISFINHDFTIMTALPQNSEILVSAITNLISEHFPRQAHQFPFNAKVLTP
ncbi:MAG: hypothetical protein COB76_00915 [Alphaproteobacteria bacterium]|nr:MAG: hypothetical protein COB76_00915 [Alphaproteobacteria bacterium]